MKKNLTTMVCYIENELKLVVYSVFNDKPFLVHSSDIIQVDINKLNSDLEKEKIELSIKNAINKVNAHLGIKIDKINIGLEAHQYSYTKKIFTYDFDKLHRVTTGDLKNVYAQAYSNEKVSDGSIVSDFTIISYVINGDRKVENPIGDDVTKLQILGEIVYADSISYYNLNDLIERTGYEVGRTVVLNHMLKQNVDLKVNEMLMDITTEKINFILNDGTDVKQFSNNIGFRTFSEELYLELLKEYSQEQAEQAVRFMINHFVLKEYEYDVNLTKDITVNKVISTYKKIITDYFKSLFDEFRKQKVIVNDSYVLLNIYEENEFVEMLNELKEINFLLFEPDIKLQEEKSNYKIRFAINELISISKILDDEKEA